MVSRKIVAAYSNERIRQKKCSTETIAFKLEIDEHVVAGMEKVMSTCIARTLYLQYLQAIHVKNLIAVEIEKFLSSLSKNTPCSSVVDIASCQRVCPTSSSVSYVSDNSDLFIDLSDPSHVPKSVGDAIAMSLTASDNEILLHLISCKKLAVKYYQNSKKAFVQTCMCNERNFHYNMGETRKEDSSVELIEIITDKIFPFDPQMFHPSKPNRSSNSLSEEKIRLELNRKRSIDEL